MREIAAGHGGGELQWTTTTDERNKLWRARHNAYFAVVATRTGTRAQTTDVCVPVSRLAESITASAADAAELPFPAAMVGHVADGNYHWICPVDTDSEAEQAALAGFVERMVTRAQEAGGTCTGEHGVGMGKREALLAQSGEAAVATMRALKRALDPRRDPQPRQGAAGRLKRAAHEVITSAPSRIAKRSADAGGAASSRSSSGRATAWPLPRSATR